MDPKPLPSSHLSASSAPTLSSPWPSLDRAAQGALGPGIYLWAGPPGCGRSQSLFQWAIHAAQLGRKTHLYVPDMRQKEAALRCAAVFADRPWYQLQKSPPEQLENYLDRLSHSPFQLSAGLDQTPPAATLVPSAQTQADSALILIESHRAFEQETLKKYLKLSKKSEATIILAGIARGLPEQRALTDSRFAPAFSLGLSQEQLALVDGVFVFSPSKSPANSLLQILKLRTGIGQDIRWQFNGARFAEEAEEMSLEFAPSIISGPNGA